MSGYLVPDAMTLLRMSPKQRMKLRELLLQTLTVLGTPSTVIDVTLRNSTALAEEMAANPTIAAAREALARVQPDADEVVRERRERLLAALTADLKSRQGADGKVTRPLGRDKRKTHTT